LAVSQGGGQGGGKTKKFPPQGGQTVENLKKGELQIVDKRKKLVLGKGAPGMPGPL